MGSVFTVPTKMDDFLRHGTGKSQWRRGKTGHLCSLCRKYYIKYKVYILYTRARKRGTNEYMRHGGTARHTAQESNVTNV